MKNQPEITVSVHLHSGEPIIFKIATEDNQVNAGSRIERIMNANYFGVEQDGKLTLIPTNSIKKVELSPAPAAMIAHVVKAVDSP